ncbi:MAG: S8 family serine peptidase [Candidatus Eisenbacteria bacterium]|uniref:S8 family serine peptidase n=1 Tax=Eiseniibacteriota bacterium TaxID=2212470 RepID=A0A956NGJ3_UNCEI|nr:S8 family serine peptidase [Candidatus Eisenbacteria bacterium]
MRVRFIAIGIALGSVLLGLLLSAVPRQRPDGSGVGPGERSTWILKLAPGFGLELADDGTLLRDGTIVPGWSELTTHLPDARVGRLFSRPKAALEADRRRGEARTGRTLPDLTLYARLSLSSTTTVDVRATVVRTLGHPEWLEAAYPEPTAQPASLELDQVAIDTDGHGAGGEGRAPDFRHGQGYLRAAPEGVGATEVWSYPGGRGASVRIVDVEGDWNWQHRDLPSPLFTYGTSIPAWRNHGTAVLGQLVGRDDGHGIVGVCPDAEVGSVSFLDLGVAAAIDLAASSVREGDIVLIELHAPGPAAPEGPGQFGYLPMEFWQDCFDAIEVATANGRIVVEAAGNGSQNLDDPRYLGLFDRSVRDSGAILVGAGTPWGFEAEWFTNRGSRIDLHGWGSAIVSTGYGTLWGGEREQDWYTAGFGGTSGAAPIVAGSAAILQSMSRSLWGVSLDPRLLRDTLVATGTPPGSGEAIGARPDLVQARELLVQGVADVRGYVRDPGGAPVPGARIVIGETGFEERGASEGGVGGAEVGDGSRDGDAPSVWEARSDAEGRYRLTVRTEPLGTPHRSTVTLHVSAPGFVSSILQVRPEPGGYLRRDFVLEPLPRSACSGRVESATGEPLDLGGAPVTIEAIAVGDESFRIAASASLGSDLAFELEGLQRDESFWIQASPVPGRSAAFGRVFLPANAPDRIEVPPLLIHDAESFEQGASGWVSESRGSTFGDWSLAGYGALSGTHGWSIGTAPEAGYGNQIDVSLVSPEILVPEDGWLTFHHKYDFELGYDGGLIEVEQGGAWRPVEPAMGYDVPNVEALGWSAGYSGRSDGWRVGRVDLSDYAGETIRVRFRAASDESVSGDGWQIDDVACVGYDLEASSAPNSPANTGFPAGQSPLLAQPNPFRDAVDFSWLPQGTGTLPVTSTSFGAGAKVAGAKRAGAKVAGAEGTGAEGTTSPGGILTIVDSGGRTVRRMPVTGFRAQWDGFDGHGNSVPSGVYWAQLRPADADGIATHPTATRRLVRIR